MGQKLIGSCTGVQWKYVYNRERRIEKDMEG
jgi:hypothetical protein